MASYSASSVHVCRAVACRALVLPTELFCERCRALLQSDVRRILERTWRPGAKRQSQIFEQTLERALGEILYAKTEGHRAPRDAEFEW